jgi:hypothetical protein
MARKLIGSGRNRYLDAGVKIPEAALPSWLTEGGLQALVSDYVKDHAGLENVDNTSDLNKPISIATQTALNEISAVAAEALTIAQNAGATPAVVDGGVP